MGGRLIHVIRHGKTEANLKKLYCGATDVPLSAEGRRELEAFKSAGCYPTGDYYYASALRRTADTLGVLYGGVDVVRLAELSEFNFGEFEMKSHDELMEDGRYLAWIGDGGATLACPCGESFQVFKARIRQGFTRVLDETPAGFSNIVLVTHGGVISCLMEMYFGSDKHFYEWQPENGRGYTLTAADGSLVSYEPL